MPDYGIEFRTSAAKEFRDLPKEVRLRVTQAVEGLRKDPRPSGVRKLKGYENLYRIRVGSYRVVYEVSDPLQRVTVTRVRLRSEAYR